MICKKEDQEHCHVWKQYEHLNKCFDKVLYELYDRHYYNYGSDTYSANTLAADDMIYKLKIYKKFLKISYIVLGVQAGIILALIACLVYVL